MKCFCNGVSPSCSMCLGTGQWVTHAFLESNERYTPLPILQSAIRVMGDIELDPASCSEANETVRAKRYFTRQENGLLLPWKSPAVWCNPPFSRVHSNGVGSYQQLFIRKMIQEYRNGNMQQGILLLLGNCAFNDYFKPLWRYPVCLNTGTVNFRQVQGGDTHYGFGTVFIYFGTHIGCFVREFKKYGVIPNVKERR